MGAELPVEGDVAVPGLYLHPLDLVEGICDDPGNVPVGLTHQQLLLDEGRLPVYVRHSLSEPAGEIGYLLTVPPQFNRWLRFW